MSMKLLSEHLNPGAARLTEQTVGGHLFLNGIMMQAELKNGNGRNYPLSEITKAVDEAAIRIKEGHSIMGELNHPDVLSINLANVSHAITEIRMDGNNAIGKMKLLNTPSGNIAKGLIEGGVRLGVSSRGTGNVNEGGNVSDFAFVTVDIVSQPSAPGAYPDVVSEAMNNNKIMTLSEAMVHDPKAQSYFKKEMLSFLEGLRKYGQLDEASNQAIRSAEAKFKNMKRDKLLDFLGLPSSSAQQTYLVMQALYKKFDKADVDRYIKQV